MKNISCLFSLVFIFLFEILQSQVCPTLKDPTGNENISTVNCTTLGSNSCYNLTAAFADLYDTGSYAVTSVPYAPRTSYTSGTPVGIYEDDMYVKRIDFSDPALFGNKPFVFSFFGNLFPSLLISSNGFVTFNQLFQEGDFSTGVISGHPIPDSYLPATSIFGVFQDLDFSQKNGSEIYYKVEGTAPCRTLTISFYKGKITGTDQYTSSQIVLHEFGNKIEVFVEGKPLPDDTARNKESVIGLTDARGGGIAAPNRNTGVWSAQNEGWQFAARGGLLRPTYEWYRNSVLLTAAQYRNRPVVSVCPTEDNEIYQVKANYRLSTGQILSYTKEITIKVAQDYPLPRDFSKIFCFGDTSVVYQSDYYSNLTINQIGNFNFKFYSTAANASAGGASEFDPAVPLNKNSTYYVRIESKANPTSCYRVAILKLGDQNSVLKTTEVQICDANNDGVEDNYALSKILCQIFDPAFKYTNPRFFIDNGTTPVTVANITAATKLYVQVNTVECGNVRYGPIGIKFTTGPNVNTFTTPVVIDVCDVVTNGNPPKRETNFDWEKYFKENNIVLTSDPNIFLTRVFLTKANALAGTGAINYINEGVPNPTDPTLDYVYKIYVRVEYEVLDTCLGACYSIIEIPVKVKFNKIILNVTDADLETTPDDPLVYDEEDADIYICSGASRNFDLDADSQKTILVTNPVNASGIYKTFHNSFAEADNLADNIGIPKNQTMAANATVRTFYVRYRLGNTVADSCYVVKRLNYRVVTFPVRSNTTPILVCSPDTSVPITITLDNYTQGILAGMWSQNPRPTVKYYQNADGTGEITTIDLAASNSPKSVYVRITSGYNPDCSQLVQYKFSVVQNPKLLTDKLQVPINCDHNNDGINQYDLTSLNPSFITNPTTYNIRYFRTYNATTGAFGNEIGAAAASFTLNASGIQRIYYRIAVNGTPCFSVGEAEFNINIINAPVKLNSNVIHLDCNVSGQQVLFNLDQTIPKLYSSSNSDFATFISSVKFYKSQSDANNQLNAITPQNAYPVNSTQVRTYVWARFESTAGCYSIVRLMLKITNPNDLAFSKGDVLEPICDDNLDGIYAYDLAAWLKNKIDNSVPGDSFLRDYEATISATYTFHLTNTSPPLTPTEVANFQPNVVSQRSVFIKADGNGCSQMMELKFDFGDTSIIEVVHPNICKEGFVDLKIIEADPRTAGAISYKYYRNEADLISGNNEITTPSQYFYEGITRLFVKINFADKCPRKGAVSFGLKPNPVFTMFPTYDICETSGQTIEVFANVSQIYTAGLKPQTYIWTLPDGTKVTNQYPDSTYDVKKAGKYSLTIIADNGCGNTVDFEVKAIDVPEIYKIVVEGNKVTVLATAKNTNRKLLYSYEGFGKWQSDYVFYSVPLGPQTFYVKYADEQGDCAAKPMQTVIVDVINTITPNGDGFNDVWKLGNLEYFEGKNTVLKIFDRYNKLVFEKEGNTEIVWDGFYGGRVLPTAAYWYIAVFPDGRQLNGWILLKNRD